MLCSLVMMIFLLFILSKCDFWCWFSLNPQRLLPPDAYRLGDFIVVPWSWWIASLQATTKLRACASTSKEFRKVIRLNKLKELFLELAAVDCDLFPCFLIYESLYDCPDTCENHWSVYDIALSHYLWIVVRSDSSSQLNERVDLLRKHLGGATVKIQNRETLLDSLPSCSRARGESELKKQFVRLDIMS